MLKGKYTGEGNLNLDREKTYFLFPLGESHYYVSKFNNINAHQGAFRQCLFTVSECSDDVKEAVPLEDLKQKKEANIDEKNVENECIDLPPERWQQISLF